MSKKRYQPVKRVGELDAILLPVDDPVPRLIKLTYQISKDEKGRDQHELLDSLGTYIGSPASIPIGLKGYAGCRGFCAGTGEYSLTLYLGDTSSIDGSPLNLCIKKLEGTGLFGGNAVVVRSVEPQWLYLRYVDATMDDIDGVTNYLKDYLPYARRFLNAHNDVASDFPARGCTNAEAAISTEDPTCSTNSPVETRSTVVTTDYFSYYCIVVALVLWYSLCVE